jgi:hypothetical protein
MGLEHLLDLFWADMSVLVEGIEPLAERLLAAWTEVTLLTVWHPSMFMDFTVSTESVFHRSGLGYNFPPFYQL